MRQRHEIGTGNKSKERRKLFRFISIATGVCVCVCVYLLISMHDAFAFETLCAHLLTTDDEAEEASEQLQEKSEALIKC